MHAAPGYGQGPRGRGGRSAARAAARSAEEVPGTAALNGGGQAVAQSVSCAPTGLCNAVGTYQNVKLNTEVFAVSQS